MRVIFPKIVDSPVFRNLKQTIDLNKKNVIRSCNGSLNAILAIHLAAQFQKPVIFISPETKTAERFFEDVSEFAGKEKAAFFPALNHTPYDHVKPNPGRISLRLETLSALHRHKNLIISIEGKAILDKISDPEVVSKSLIELVRGQEYDLEFLAEELMELGFERVDIVDQMGEFAIRGGIVDIFSWNNEKPHRLEFWGDDIESIRTFDVLTQRSDQKVEKAEILGNPGDKPHHSSILRYLEDGIIWIDEPHILENRLQEHWQYISQLYGRVKDDGHDYLPPDNYYWAVDDISDQVKKLADLYSGYVSYKDLNVLNLNSDPPPKFSGNVQKFPEFLARIKKEWPTLYIFAEMPEQVDRILEIIEDSQNSGLGGIGVRQGALSSGFALRQMGLMVMTHHELFRQMRRRKTIRKVNSASYLRTLRGLNYNDLVVHVDYGIAIYKGLDKIKVGGNLKECALLEYADGGSLYVHFENLNKIQKYSSEEGIRPAIHKLGGKTWDREKVRTRNAVEKIARDLVEVYAQRMQSKGFAFTTDTKWQRELEASFPYEDTHDQVTATADVKKDMEKLAPMDRLICGDVGFGKTEVALRGAFKAVQDSKQVAVLVPTTILASQHYETFSERIRDFPVEIGVLSRFSTQKQQRETLSGLANGTIDIVIGTHRLLSEDVKFKDLGLLIVDEEQRFGVKHKEKLKKMRLNVDILSMSATPIPRTLHMSLMGVRELSNIETPPRNRLPIVTEIIQWEDDTIARAINFELSRDGQVFFVHNRVETIEAVKSILQNIIPDAKIAIAHGQMPERQLEKVMHAFKNKEFDVLVSTMIIENGLDIPSTNTIIINKADKFGLSQLYQLRGRVGRSEVQAYAYLIAPHSSKLTDIAMKRLNVIEEFTELGSGFKLALRDLEIRGAGNLLGHQQSGFINSVGFEMYVKILNEAVEDLKSDLLPERKRTRMPLVETKLDLDTDMFFPEDYIENANERMGFYHKLLYCENLMQLEEVRAELEDRFGRLPEKAQILIAANALKIEAGNYFVSRIILRKNSLKIFFAIDGIETDQLEKLNFPNIVKSNELMDVRFEQKRELILNATVKGLTIMQRLNSLMNLFINLDRKMD